MGNLFYVFYNSAKRNRWLYIFILFILLLLASYSISRIQLEENITKIIPKDEKIDKINALFDNSRFSNLLVAHIYQTDTVEGDPSLLINLSDKITDTLKTLKPHYVNQVIAEYPDTLINTYYDLFYKYLPIYLTDSDYVEIENRITLEGINTSMRKNLKSLMSPLGMATKEMIIRDPLSFTGLAMDNLEAIKPDEYLSLYQNHLMTEDKRHLVFFIELSNPPNETKENKVVIDWLKSISSNVAENYSGVQFEYFGSTAISVANAGRIKKDIMLTVNLALVFLFLIITFFYRRLPTFFIVVLPGLFGAAIGLAILSLIRENVSTIALGVGSVLLGVTIDYALHFFTHFKHQKDTQKLFNDLSVPILMSSTTTACAFFALIFIRSEALQELGIFAGISVLSAALFSLTVLPHLVISKSHKPQADKKNIVEKIIYKLAEYPVHKNKWVIVLIVLITVMSLFTWQDISFERDMMNLNYMPEHLSEYEKNLNEISDIATKKVFVVASGDDIWEALHNNRKVIQQLEQLKKDSLIIGFSSLNSLIPDKEAQRQKIDRWQNFWSEHDKSKMLNQLDSISGELGFRPSTFETFKTHFQDPFPLIQNDDLQLFLETVGNEYLIRSGDEVSVINTLQIDRENKPIVVSSFTGYDQVYVLDKGYVTNRLVEVLSEDFNKLVNISLAVVFLLLLVVYGRIEIAINTFLPIVAGWLWTLGLMSLFNLSFNIVNIIVCTFIFGLGIDYSIFIMRGLTQQYKSGVNNIVSYKRSIIISAITTCTGIGVLIFAQHPALKSIASLAVFGILSAIILSFTLQYVVYNFFVLRRKQKGVIPYTLISFLLTIIAFGYFLFGCLLLFLIRYVLLIPFAGVKKRKYIYHFIMMAFCRSIVYLMVNVSRKLINRHNIDFNKPSVIIANHHSFIDILYMLSLSSKMAMVTNKWVYHSPFFGKAVQFADFVLADKGIEHQIDKIRELVKDGYSLMIFPEGTRSTSAKIGRFHKGAFYVAEQLNLNIQPVILHGTHYTIPKGDFCVRNGHIIMKFLPAISPDDKKWGNNYSERTKAISRYFKSEYQKLRETYEVPAYYKEKVIKNYLYKNPVLEWYIKIKFKLEKGYRILHELIPFKADVVDVGCGYGYIDLTLAYCGEGRNILGIDYDEKKIEIARNCPAIPSNVQFVAGDAVYYDYPDADVFVLSDVLHYLLIPEQERVLNKINERLRPGGKIIIREGDIGRGDKHKGTVLTEIFSTRSGFNKARNELNFISKDQIIEFAKKNNLSFNEIDTTRYTSNVIFVLEKSLADVET